MNKKRKRFGKGLSWLDLLELSLSSIRANFLRSLLTILGVSIGVFSVVGVMTAISAVRQSIDSGLNIFGADVFQISRNPAINMGGPRRNKRPKILPRDARQFKELMESEGIPTSLSVSAGGRRVLYKDKKTGPRINVTGTNEHFLSTNKYEIALGRPLSASDIEFNRPVIVIGHEVLESLFPNEDPLDKDVTIPEGRFTVIGVLKERGNLFGQSMDGIALIPHARFRWERWRRGQSMDIAVQAPSVAEIPETQDIAIGHMRTVRGLDPEDPNNFEITTNQGLQDSFGKVAGVVATGGLLISGIALVCAGIGIMNIMLVSVTERTKEIGLRKALGARKKNILTQFLLEAIFLSEAGAIIGIVLGMAAGNVAAKFANASMIIPWFWIGTAFFICSVIGIGFGFLPAWRAAKMHPVDALRHE